MPAASAAVVVGRHPSLTDSSRSTDVCDEEHLQCWEELEETDDTVLSATHQTSTDKMEETTIVFGQEEEEEEDNHSDDDEETTIVFGNGVGGEQKADFKLSVSSKIKKEAGGVDEENEDETLLMNRLDYAHDILATMNIASKGSRRATMHGGCTTSNGSALLINKPPPRAKASRRVTYASATGPTTPMWMDNNDLDLSQPIASPNEAEEEPQKIVVQRPPNLGSSMKRRSLPAVTLPKLPSLFPAGMATSPTKLANEIRRRKSDVFDRRKAREVAEAALREQEEAMIIRKQKAEEEAAAAAKRRQAEAERQRQQQRVKQQQQKAEAEAAAAKRREAETQQRQRQQQLRQQKAKEEKMAAAAVNAEKWVKATGRRSRRTRSTTGGSSSRQDLGSIVATRRQATRRKSTPVKVNTTTSAPKHEENSTAAARVIATATATTPRRRRSTATSSRQDLAAVVTATRQQATRMKSTPVVFQNNNTQKQEEASEKAAATATATPRQRTRSTASYTRGDLASIVTATAQRTSTTRRKSAPVIKNSGSQFVDNNEQDEKTAPDAPAWKVKAAPVIFQNSTKGQSVDKQAMAEKDADADAEKVKATRRRRSRRTRSTANSSRQDLAAIVATKQVTRRKSAPVIDSIDEIDEDKESQFVLEEAEAYQKALTTTAAGKVEATVAREKPAAVPEEEEEELDEDIRALKERIAKLECKLRQTTVDEETEIEEVRQQTEKRKEEFRTQKGLLSNRERATLVLNTVKRGVTLRAMKRIIADMQGSNRNYRMVIRNLSANLEELYEQKHELQQSTKWARIQSMKNSTKMGDQENHYFGLTEHLPDYRHWIDGLRKEQVRRNHLIQYEKRTLARYNETMDIMLSRIFQTSSAAEKQENDNRDGLVDNGHQENDDSDGDFLRAIRKAANTKKHAKAARKAARRHSKSSRTIVYEYITRKVPQEGTR